MIVMDLFSPLQSPIRITPLPSQTPLSFLPQHGELGLILAARG